MHRFFELIFRFSSQLPPQLLNLIQDAFNYSRNLEDEVAALKAEIARLKSVPGKPDFKSSKKDDSDADNDRPNSGNKGGSGKKRGGSKKGQERQNKKDIEIHETVVIRPSTIPEGAKLKDRKEFTVQDIEIKNKNTRFFIERWTLTDGTIISGDLPIEIDGHYGTNLIKYILYQFHHCRVTEPLLLEELREMGVLISSGQLHKILTEGHELFHTEKESILQAGLTGTFVQVDDTGNRHNEQNGFTTVLCSNLFTVYESTDSKSRINFLEVLQGLKPKYTLTTEGLEYLKRYHLPPHCINKLQVGIRFHNKREWEFYLTSIKVENPLHVRLVTEAALLGGLTTSNINPDLVILSDDAGQFNILNHALCWIHAERLIKKLEPINDTFASEQAETRAAIWSLYNDLKVYKETLDLEKAKTISEQFDSIFLKEYQFTSLKLAMKRLYKNKDELLLVLKYPQIPIHNNDSEVGARDRVVRRKISVTFADESLRCRDTFASLKKTCRKLGYSFWCYLDARLNCKTNIPNLGLILRNKILSSA